MSSQQMPHPHSYPDPNTQIPQEQITPRRTPMACQFCRGRKIKCDGRATCANCNRRNIPCIYVPVSVSTPAKQT